MKPSGMMKGIEFVLYHVNDRDYTTLQLRTFAQRKGQLIPGERAALKLLLAKRYLYIIWSVTKKPY